MTREEAIAVFRGFKLLQREMEAVDMAIKALEQEHCEMTAEEYRQRMIQAFHNADCGELIAVCVLPTEKEFEYLEWLLKNHYKKELCEDWHDVPSDEMTLEQARRAVKDLRKKLAEYLMQEPCEDCISRDAVIKLICQNNDRYGYSDRFHEFTERCLQLPLVTPQPKLIPCSERLPEKNGLYLVTQLRHSLDDIDHKRPSLGKEVDYVEYQDGWCVSRIFDVIAWMPLPEPFAPDMNVDSKEESEEDR